ncbi:hypothetical protein DXG03_002240 [Asterophora parasitica]|uniref:X-box-binding protein 1 n=1 Tax=Asterophora parasitica TaxID=117018 RepID=A0A9P7G453_9AGAR|nr:hypothetical protein DXG03_002240 [Asterophora parasitica]
MNFIDPASLTDPESTFMSSPSPSPSCDSTQSNPRKRPRTDASSEDRKEARAHRNRIAAQNSRDRRKAQFAYLERRVAELEDENRALRAARGVPPPLPVSVPTPTAEDQHKRENEELRDRIKTLERGWDAVIKALAAQGLPLASPQPATTTVSPPQPTTNTNESTRHLARVATIGAPPMSLQRVDSVSTFSSLPPPSPSTTTSSSSPSTPTTPHPTPTTQTDPDDATMENLFMEILASPLPAPALPHTAAATPGSAAQAAREEEVSVSSVEGVAGGEVGEEVIGSGEVIGEGVNLGMIGGVEGMGAWDTETLEMNRILALLGGSTGGYEHETELEWEMETEQGLSELELEMGWGTLGLGVGVGVF